MLNIVRGLQMKPFGAEISEKQSNTMWIDVHWSQGHLGPLLLTWFNFNPALDK